jgi:hypothetical protein
MTGAPRIGDRLATCSQLEFHGAISPGRGEGATICGGRTSFKHGGDLATAAGLNGSLRIAG